MARRQPPSRLIGSGLIPQEYQDQYNNIENDYTTGMAGLGKEQGSLFQDYGFQGGIDEQGGVNFATDPNNRFGKYQQLIQSIGAQIAAAKQETSGRGIGKRGLAKARESLIRDMSSADKSGLVNSFSRSAADIFGRRGAALGNRNRGFAGVEGGALDWWNQNGPEDPNAQLDAGPAGGPEGPPGSMVGGQAAGPYMPDPYSENPGAAQQGLSDYYGAGGQAGGGIPAGYAPTFGQPKLPANSLTDNSTTTYKRRPPQGFNPYSS